MQLGVIEAEGSSGTGSSGYSFQHDPDNTTASAALGGAASEDEDDDYGGCVSPIGVRGRRGDGSGQYAGKTPLQIIQESIKRRVS